MATSERDQVMSQADSPTAAVRGTDAGGGPALAQTTAQPGAPKAQKELLCTICNLRACWEAPETPAATR